MRKVLIVTACIKPNDNVRYATHDVDKRIKEYGNTLNEVLTSNADNIIFIDNSSYSKEEIIDFFPVLLNDRFILLKGDNIEYTNKGIGEDNLVTKSVRTAHELYPNEELYFMKLTGRVPMKNIDFNLFDENSIYIPYNHNEDFINKKKCFPSNFKYLSWCFAFPSNYEDLFTNLYGNPRNSYEIHLRNKLNKSGQDIKDFPFFEIPDGIKIGVFGSEYSLYKEGL